MSDTNKLWLVTLEPKKKYRSCYVTQSAVVEANSAAEAKRVIAWQVSSTGFYRAPRAEPI